MTELIGVLIAGISAGFSMLTVINQRNSKLNERLTKLEVHSSDVPNLVSRVVKLESSNEFIQKQLLELETELKEMMRQIRHTQLEILRSSKN